MLLHTAYRLTGDEPPRRREAQLLRILVTLGIALLAAACINPFSGGRERDKDEKQVEGVAGTDPAVGALEISLADEIAASTVAPNGSALADTIAYYALTLTDPGGTFARIHAPSLAPGSFPYAVPEISAINWQIELAAYDAGNNLVGAADPVTVQVDPGGTSVTLHVRALQTGASGSFCYDLSWPVSRVDGATVELRSVSSFSDPVATSTPVAGFLAGDDYTLDIGGGTLDVDTVLPSASYYLVVTLSYAGAPYPTVYEAVQIYDHLESHKTVALTESEFTDPPVAPTGLTATLTGDGQFQLNWVDNSTMEAGFKVYRNILGGGAELTTPPSSATSGDLFGASGTPVTFYVTAYNVYGESSAAQTTFEPVGIPASLDPAPGDPWVLINGETFSWSSAGAERWDLYFSASESLVQNLDPSVVIATDLTNPTTPLPTIDRLTNYYWRIAARRTDTLGNVLSPTALFTSRSADIYVSTVSGDDVTGDGSPGSPFESVGRALTEAWDTPDLVTGDVVHIEGNISESTTFAPSKGLKIIGSYDPGFATRTGATNDATRATWSSPGPPFPNTVIAPQAGVSIAVDGLNILATGSTSPIYGIHCNGGSLEVSYSTVSTDAAVGSSRGIYVQNGVHLLLENSLLQIGAAGGVESYGVFCELPGGSVDVISTRFEEPVGSTSNLRTLLHTEPGTGAVQIDDCDLIMSDGTGTATALDISASTVQVGMATPNSILVPEGTNARGIRCTDCGSVEIGGNTIQVAMGPGLSQGGIGIAVTGSGNADLTGNDVTLATTDTAMTGVTVDNCGSARVENNVIHLGSSSGLNAVILGISTNNTPLTGVLGNSVNGGTASAVGASLTGISCDTADGPVSGNTITGGFGYEAAGLVYNGVGGNIFSNVVDTYEGDYAATGIQITGDGNVIELNHVADLFIATVQVNYRVTGISVNSGADHLIMENNIFLSDPDNPQTGVALYSGTGHEARGNTVVFGSTDDAPSAFFSLGVDVRTLETLLVNNVIVKEGRIGVSHRYRGIHAFNTIVVEPERFQMYIYNNSILVIPGGLFVNPGEWVGMEFAGGEIRPDVRNNFIAAWDNAISNEESGLKWYTDAATLPNEPYNISGNLFAGVQLLANHVGTQQYTSADLGLGGPGDLDNLFGPPVPAPAPNRVSAGDIPIDMITYEPFVGFVGAGYGENVTGAEVPGNPGLLMVPTVLVPGVNTDRNGAGRTVPLAVGAFEVD